MTSRAGRLAGVALLAALGCSSGVARRIDGARASDPHSSDSASSSKIAPATLVRAAASVGSAPEARVDSSASGTPVRAAVTRLQAGGERVVRGEFGVVASEDTHASRVGAAVLEQGGNAVDATVAMAFALAVTHPIAGALGGGGFMLVRMKGGEARAIDFREVAPARASKAANERQLRAGAHGYLSAPVPGIVAGLTFARDRFGTRPLADLVAPAVRLAAQGHPLAPRQARLLRKLWRKIGDRAFRRSMAMGKRPLSRGEMWKQPDLARTLQAISESGADGFYRGAVARSIADAMRRHGGLVTESDLAAYQAKERTPLHIEYRGLDVYTMPPPSMGGIAVLEILRALSLFGDEVSNVDSVGSVHAFIESARRAYADRRSVGADPDAVDATAQSERIAELLSSRYHQSRRPSPSLTAATPSTQLLGVGAVDSKVESRETTHLSVMDRDGNAVACTVTLSAGFGAYVRVPGAGVILSNAMGGFSKDGINAVAPGKRMASSMSPTLIVRQGETVAVLGSPGGDTIPNTIAQLLVHLVDQGMTLDDAVDAPRLHHQYFPDEVLFERTHPPSSALVTGLEALGHVVKPGPRQGSANCVLFDPDSRVAYAYADPRTGGVALAPGRPPK